MASYEELKNKVRFNLPDNTQQLITPAKQREVLNDILDKIEETDFNDVSFQSPVGFDPGNKTLAVDKASEAQDGYLAKEDFAAFKKATKTVRTSIDEIRNSEGLDPDAIYLTADFGVSGEWQIDPDDDVSEDNTGTVLVTADDVRVKRIFKGTIDVRWFGAVGDGITDDTQAIEVAVSLASDAGHIIIPVGSYLVKSPIEIAASGITISGGGTLLGDGIGSGSSDSFVTVSGNNNRIIDIHVTGTDRVGQYLIVSGNNNVVLNCKVGAPEPLTYVSTNYQLHCIRVTGNGNVIDGCELYNQAAGVNVRFKNNAVRNCLIYKNQMGVYLSASCRDTVIEGNVIVENDVTEDDGCDGIYAQRNVSRITITNNIIYKSGEHGIYFQGDSSIISNNTVHGCVSSGIKLASYNTQLYWYEDETPVTDYIGYGNVVANNIIKDCTTGGGTSGGIYLQAPLTDILVSNNYVSGCIYGIRTAVVTAGSADLILSNFQVIGNRATNNTTSDFWLQVKTGLVASDNTVGNFLLHITSPDRVSGAVLSGNQILGLLTVSNCDDPVLRGNTFSIRPSVNSNCNRIVFIGNIINQSDAGDINLRRYAVFDNNIVSFPGQFTADLSVVQLRSFCNNIINSTRDDFADTDYLIYPSSNIMFNSAVISGNNITLAKTTMRTMRVYGANNVISNNKSNSSSTRCWDIYSTDSVIVGNVGAIAFQSGATGNVVAGNKGAVGGTLSGQKVDTVAASADAASVTDPDAVAVLSELRDLKSKMREAGLLAT